MSRKDLTLRQLELEGSNITPHHGERIDDTPVWFNRFKDHEVYVDYYAKSFQRMHFRNPNNSWYNQWFVLDGQFLTTYGDMDNAVYSWGSGIQLTWRTVGDLHVEGLRKRLTATEAHGTERGQSWCPVLAREQVVRYLQSLDVDEGASDDLRKRARQMLNDEDYDQYLDSEFEASGFLSDNYDVFGHDWYEMLPDMRKPATFLYAHCYALDFAFKMLQHANCFKALQHTDDASLRDDPREMQGYLVDTYAFTLNMHPSKFIPGKSWVYASGKRMK